MNVPISYTFLISGDRYDLIGIAGGDLVPPDQLGPEPKELHTTHRFTFELTPEALYFRGRTAEGDNVRYLPLGAIQTSKNSRKNAASDLCMALSFTGKIRLAKDPIEDAYVPTGHQKALAYRTVLDIAIQAGRLTDVMDRSFEMEQKREALSKYRKSTKTIENIRHRKGIYVRNGTELDEHVVALKDHPRIIQQKGDAVREYYVSAIRLKNVFCGYDLDLDLE